jgi:hypothetical protein
MVLNIVDNVTYRIQNVDLGTFLEVNDRDEVVMRPSKDSAKQHVTITYLIIYTTINLLWL